MACATPRRLVERGVAHPPWRGAWPLRLEAETHRLRAEGKLAGVEGDGDENRTSAEEAKRRQQREEEQRAWEQKKAAEGDYWHNLPQPGNGNGNGNGRLQPQLTLQASPTFQAQQQRPQQPELLRVEEAQPLRHAGREQLEPLPSFQEPPRPQRGPPPARPLALLDRAAAAVENEAERLARDAKRDPAPVVVVARPQALEVEQARVVRAPERMQAAQGLLLAAASELNAIQRERTAQGLVLAAASELAALERERTLLLPINTGRGEPGAAFVRKTPFAPVFYSDRRGHEAPFPRPNRPKLSTLKPLRESKRPPSAFRWRAQSYSEQLIAVCQAGFI